MTPKEWYAAEVTARPATSEAIEYGLMEAGALGTETTAEVEGEVRITGYFQQPIDETKLQRALVDAWRLYNHIPIERIDVRLRAFAERDWLAEWKKSWRPVAVGRFIIAPPWLSETAETAGGAGTATIIRINPGMAFGTGTHETTRLCLQAIERHFRGGSLLDVGTGTGILAIAAAKMFPKARIEACDTDAEAIEIARENARLNDVAEHIAFRTGTVGDDTASADLVCANLTAPVIVDLLPALLGATCGRLVLAGILDTQAEMVQSRLFELGATVLERNQDGEWVAMVV
jgi:ribosomal protein L11 methyltransferase